MSDLDKWILHGDEMRRPFLANSKLSESSKLVIVGGGLSGLSCAFRIAKKRPDIEIIIHEQSFDLGGVITTWRQDDWTCDTAVNASRPHPSFWRLINDLGLQSKFKPSKSDAKSRWILLDGKQHRLSWRTLFKIGPLKLRKSIKKSRNGGMSVADVIPNKQIADAMCLGIVNDTSENVDADFLFPAVTKFGSNPPIKKSKLNKLISETYPIFSPKKGSIASLDGGMQTLIDALSDQISNLDNVTIIQGDRAKSPESVAAKYEIPLESIIWTAPNPEVTQDYSKISIFAIGYKNQQVSQVKTGYGTLIPSIDYPISGILHESDVHDSARSPDGHRLFRLMVPDVRWDGDLKSVQECAENLLAPNPVIFEKIGDRTIPRYKPGHMGKVAKINPKCTYVGWHYSGVAITHVVDQAERIAELF